MVVTLKLFNQMEPGFIAKHLQMPYPPRVGEMFTFATLPEPYQQGVGPWHFRVSDIEYLVGDDDGYVIVVTCRAVM